MEEYMLTDELKPHMEIIREEPPVEMETANLLEMITDILVEEKVDCVFGLTSGHSAVLENSFQHVGIKRVHVRHEQCASFAADAYGRVTRRPGVVLTGDGTAAGYVSAGLGQAYAAQSPLVHLQTCHQSGAYDTTPFFGRFDPEHMYKDLVKWVRRLDRPEYVLFELKRAFRSAVTPPTGPVTLALHHMMLMIETERVQPKYNFLFNYNPGFFPPRKHETQANPALVEEVMKWLTGARQPVIIAGEGVHYDDAVEELNELVALTGIPCHTRRVARGAFSEDNPLNCGGRARGKVFRKADRCLILGLRVGYLENHGDTPFWSHEARYCQVQTCPDNINFTLPTEMELVGNMKLVLRQMIDCVKAMGITKPPDKWDEWRRFVADARAEYWRRAIEMAKPQEGAVPLHPNLLGKQIGEFLREELKDDYILIFDGLTAAGYTTDWVTAVRSGQILDSGECIGLGHGMGMAIGAGMATDRRVPIVALVGDGGIGAGGMDIETASKWDIPVLFVLFNNGCLGGAATVLSIPGWGATGDIRKDSWTTLEHIRYDEMFKAFDCHGELVQQGTEIKPALKRAMDYVRSKSKPAVVNCFTDPLVFHEIYLTLGLLAFFGHIPWNEIPEMIQQLIIARKLVPPQYLAFCEPGWVEAITQAR